MAAQLQFTPMPGALQYILHTKVTYPHNLHMVESLIALFLNRTEIWECGCFLKGD